MNVDTEMGINGDNHDIRRGICINDRLWFKTNLKLGQVLYEMNEIYKLQHVIKELLRNHESQEKLAERSSLRSSSSGSSTHLLKKARSCKVVVASKKTLQGCHSQADQAQNNVSFGGLGASEKGQNRPTPAETSPQRPKRP